MTAQRTSLDNVNLESWDVYIVSIDDRAGVTPLPSRNETACGWRFQDVPARAACASLTDRCPGFLAQQLQLTDRNLACFPAAPRLHPVPRGARPPHRGSSTDRQPVSPNYRKP